jgi:NAD(P)-dependent dehydrogenase (short-subunit alcohol dehydrogenase family)
MNIENKTILITGANRGIGRALVEEALRRGAQKVYAGTRGPWQHSDKRPTPLTLDVTNAAQIQRADQMRRDHRECRERAAFAMNMDCTKRNQSFAGAALRNHHACPRLPPAFGQSHDCDRLCGKRPSQQSFESRGRRILHLMQRGKLFKYPRSQ